MTGYAVETEILENVAIINLRCALNVAKNIESRCGLKLPDHAFAAWSNGEVTTARLAPDQWWLRTHLDHEAPLFKSLTSARENAFCAVSVVTDHFQGFRLKGEQTTAILAQAMSIDLRQLEAGTVTRGKFARTGATLFVTDPRRDVDVFVESSYADYVSAWLERAIGTDL